MRKLAHEFVDEFKYEIHTNSREFVRICMNFFGTKNWLCMNDLYCRPTSLSLILHVVGNS